ncbi:MAG: putative drug exporter of the superfamily, partial [Thermoleophilaceae bacterium]|nr:putative drug exporter of the superfamily [Thermoleophilaceae bacterium]
GVANRLGPYGADDPATESVKTSDELERATGLATTDSVVVLVRGSTAPVATALRTDPAIGAVSPPARSRDGRSAYVVARFKRDVKQKDAVHRLEAKLGSRPGVTVGGGAVANVAVNQIVQDDLTRAELLAFPILFLLSFWFFRSLVASALPLLVGGLSIVLTFLGLRIASEGLSLSVFALNLVTGLGLGLAIDYSLFMVSRYREEVAEHGAGATALVRTVTTAGRTVLFSSLTVAAALASLLVFPQKFLYSMGVGGAMVALLAAAVALIVLPAVLALLGTRVNALAPKRLRSAAELDARHEARGWWYRLSRLVMRRPARVAVLSAAFLIALGLPFLGVKFTSVDATVLPKDEPARVVDSALKRDFPAGRTTPIVVAAHTPTGPTADRFARELRTVKGVVGVAPPRAAGPGLTRIDVFTAASDLSEASQSLVRRLRALHAPFDVGVGGRTASFVDQKSSLAGHMPIALAWLAITTFVVLFLFTGSVILPLKALVMNALTISAAFGILVFVFQDGRLEGLLGYVSQGALESSQPVVLFAVAFGLSTDYGVFLLSRIKEARDSGVPDGEAVAVGLERTGRIVTAAALLFCVAIGAFATSRIIFIKEVGIGTAVAVLIDATVVRALLVPSLMELLGRWNWWAPRPLRRLHARFGPDEGVANAARAG